MVKTKLETIYFRIGLAIGYLDETNNPIGIAKILDNGIMNRFTYEYPVEEILNQVKRCNNVEIKAHVSGTDLKIKFQPGNECGLLMTVICDDDKPLVKMHEGESIPSLDFGAYCDRVLDLCDGITIASFEGKVI